MESPDPPAERAATKVSISFRWVSIVSYPDPCFHSSGKSRSDDVIHPQLWESGSGYETRVSSCCRSSSMSCAVSDILYPVCYPADYAKSVVFSLEHARIE